MNAINRLFDRISYAILIMAKIALGAMTSGCTSKYPNPSFPISPDEAKARLEELKSSKKPLTRPLLVLGGFFDPGIGTAAYRRLLSGYVEGDIIPINFADRLSFESCRQRVIE